MIIHANQESFEKIKNSGKLFLLDVYATWCGPCQMLAREFEKLEKQNVPFDIVKIDADENFELASQLKVDVLPTMFVFKDGKQIARTEGYMPASKIEEYVKQFM